jgi:Zn-dependent protease with chaperone function
VLQAAALKVMVVVGVLLVLIGKSLWVKVQTPQGHAVTPEQAPELFVSIRRLRRSMRAPRIHEVLVTDDFNAAVVQVPRLGIFGWPKNHLLIGLPLMRALTVDQFEAVLAHEFAHLAHGHGRLANWVYCQRVRWGRLLATFEDGRRGHWLVGPFLKRFGPYFNAYSFPLARANEFEADAAATRVTSKVAMADALTSVAVVGAFLSERYWPSIARHAEDHPSPAFAPYASMGGALAQSLDPIAIKAYLTRAVAVKTGLADTHPALKDRLRAVGGKARLALPEDGVGAARLLGSALEALTHGFDQRWQERVAPAWAARHQAVKEGRDKLAALDARVANGESLSIEEGFERAQLTYDVGRDHLEAIAQLRALRERADDDVMICYALGSRLIASDNAEGVSLLEKAMDLDEMAIVHVLEQLRDFHARAGRDDVARAYHERMSQRLHLEQQAHHERGHVVPEDRFEDAGLSDEVMHRLRQQMAKVPEVLHAWIARKQVQHLAHRPCYVIAFEVTPWWRARHPKRVAEAVEALKANLSFPGETLLVNIEGDHAALRARFKRLNSGRLAG